MRPTMAVLTLLGFATALPAQEAPSWSGQVRPFLLKYCVECHPGKDPDGGISLDSYKGLMAGGDRGSVLTPGKPDTSQLLRIMEGKARPAMPPRRSPQPSREELAVVRAWIAAGAREDSGAIGVRLSPIAPRRPLAAPVSALAYAPSGAVLAAGGHREVFFVDPKSGDVSSKLGGLPGKVTALAFAPSGTLVAVAVRDDSLAGVVRLYQSGPGGWTAGPALTGHADAVYALAFSPDGKTLATAGYDRLIKLWTVPEGKAVRDLKDHSDTVYGLAFSPDGAMLASGSADRAVKVWDVADGRRLYTLGDATDWVYCLAWHGPHLAAGGVDKSVRVWEASPSGGRLVHSAFAHEAAVLRLAYGPGGKTLYSLGEDRRLKAWDAATMVERHVYDVQPGDVLALAVRPDGGQLAVGRYDGALVLLDEKTGKPQSQPLPVKPKPPALKKLSPAAGPRGREVVIECETTGGAPQKLVSVHPGVVARRVEGEGQRFRVTFPADTPAGVYPLKVANEAGESNPLSFTVDLFSSQTEAEPNDSPRTAQPVTLSSTLSGALDRAGQVDFFRFEAKANQQVGVQALTATLGSKLDPVLELTGPDGDLLAEGAGSLGIVCPKDGTYALGVRDRDYRGGPEMTYRLHVGEVPVVTAVFPLGVRRGGTAEVTVEGVHLGPAGVVKVAAPADAKPGTRLPVKISTPLGPPAGDASVVVGEFAGVRAEEGKVVELPVESTGDGRLLRPGTADTWKVRGKKGERLLLEVEARRLGAPLDSYLEVLDAKGNPLPLATLRSVSRTYTTFRDHDSAAPGIRIETWGDLAVNDYLHVGAELIRIRALPKNPDDDCQFFTEGVRRLGYLGTTPGQIAYGAPMYKVTLHPPGTAFPPNGLPVMTLYHQNDDGGAAFGKDSRLTFDVPADGDYLVRVGDARGQAGPRHAYRLTVRRPRPDFAVRVNPAAPSVWQGGGVPVTVEIDRKDGFEGEVTLKVEGLPPGFRAPTSNVLAGENSTVLALFAEAGATVPPKAAPWKVVGSARIEGKEVVREVVGGMPKVVPPGDLATTTAVPEVTIRPGGEARLTVQIERLGGFTGRVPVDVRGLPHGVRVLDIGLNGILVIPGETRRTIVLYCEPWVKPTAHPFVVLSRSERKNTEHAAPSVLLKVAK